MFIISKILHKIKKGDYMKYIEIIVNTILIYFIILLIIRMLGKREVGEISIFDLVVSLLIADISTIGIQNNNILISVCALLSLLILQKSLALLVLKVPKLRTLLDGKCSIIVFKNKINLKEMKKQRYSFDDLITQARVQGIMSLDQIELAILESSGELSIFKKEDASISILPVVVSGKVDTDALEFLCLNEKDIEKELKKINQTIKETFYLASDGKKYYTIKNHHKL